LTLAGPHLALALLAASLAGVGAGVTLEGWRHARGLPPLEVTADAGVRLEVDAGVVTSSRCAASVEHWNTITVPGPIRYVVVDGGTVQLPPEVVTVLVPDLRLSGSADAVAAFQASGTAEAHISTRLDAVVAPERPWSASGLISYRASGSQLAVGVELARELGPFVLGVGVLVPPSEPGAVAVLGRVGVRF
jgi:hypothetical protein